MLIELRAGWEGSRIILRQASPESEEIFDMFMALFRDHELATIRSLSQCSTDDWDDFLSYAGQFLSNMGNFKTFGDSKFIPRISSDIFTKILSVSSTAKAILPRVIDAIYQYKPEAVLLLGMPGAGHTSGYYHGGLSDRHIAEVHKVLEAQSISSLNTRFFKLDDKIHVRLAADHKGGVRQLELKDGTNVLVELGDHVQEMPKIAKSLESAEAYSANDIQRKMCSAYAKSFRSGSIDEHKDSQRWWIKDIAPTVECNIGFIEPYRDPSGVIAEWEGFVAVQNVERTKVFSKMVNEAPKFIERLPWPKDFEKDTFTKPDFTSIEILSFCTGGIPAGINIPNYDDIRQTQGFKNVSLGNVLNAKAPNEVTTFVKESDRALYDKLKGPSFEVQVGIHELLGHGTGKLLAEIEPGKFNFDKQKPPISPIDNKPITTWYGVGETWGSKFGSIAASYEEARAEAVAMYLVVEKEMLTLFGHTGDSEEKADDIVFVSYLSMARAGLMALEFWDPPTNKWGQAHMMARFGILQSFLQAGQGFISLDQNGDNITINLDRKLIATVGRAAVGNFLQKV